MNKSDSRINTNNIAHCWLVGLLLLILSALSPVIAESNIEVTQHWFEDNAVSLSIEEARQAFKQGRGAVLEETVFRLGNKPTQIWVLLQATNQTEKSVSMRLLAGVPYSPLMNAQLVKPEMRQLIDEHNQQAFSARNSGFRLLNSASFVLGAGEQAEIVVQTIVEGPSYLPFSILTESAFANLQLSDSVFGALFYGFSVTLGLLFLLFSIAVRHRIALLYAGLFLLGLLAVADIDGYAFQWLWPNSPQWNHYSPIVILPLLNSLGFIVIHQLLHSVDASKYRRVKQAILVLAAISLLVPFLFPVLPLSTLIQIENLLSVPAFLLQPVAFTTWLYLGRRSYISLAALLMIGLAVLTLVSTVFINIDLPGWLMEHVHHLAYGIVGVMVMSIITAQLMGLNKDQEATLKRELVLAQQNARMNEDLLKAEKNYAQAQRLASQRRQQLASASHDLRQPIVSLRASVDAISRHQTQDVRKQLKDAFNYLEQLCGQYLQQTRPEEITTGKSDVPQSTEAYPVSLVFNTVQRMFTKEAADRNIELRIVDSGLLLETEPLVVMRIVSNLVSNAVKHHTGSERPRVLLGCRRVGNSLRILVCDNGSGMSLEQISELQQPYQKGENSEGEGLGLAIVKQLTEANQLTLSIRSRLGKGSCFGVEISLAEAR